MSSDATTSVAEPLMRFLAATVPLRMHDLTARGGPGDADFARARAFAAVLTGGDGLFGTYGGKRRGETARLASGLADALAVMAFVPGGVRAFGQHWQAAVPHA